MMELSIIKCLGICGMITVNVILALIAMFLIEEYFYFKGDNDE